MERAVLPYPVKLWFLNIDPGTTGIRYGTKMSPQNRIVLLMESQHNVVNPTNPRCALDDGVQDRLHVRGRAADNAEHLSRCRLMLQRLAQFCVALLEFFEEPHVLDGDHGLVGEGLEQGDLFFRERANFQPANQNGPDRSVLSK